MSRCWTCDYSCMSARVCVFVCVRVLKVTELNTSSFTYEKNKIRKVISKNIFNIIKDELIA